MMIKTIIASFTALIVSSPAYAQTESSYQPFRYETSCAFKFAYKWEYKIGEVGQLGNWSNVMPGFYVQNVSWD
jgi:hypothetical protein